MKIILRIVLFTGFLISQNSWAQMTEEQLDMVLPVMNAYCMGCHSGTNRVFKLGFDERRNREAIIQNYDEIVRRVTRSMRDIQAPAFMPPRVSREFFSLSENPQEYRQLVIGLIGENAMRDKFIRLAAYAACSGCHNSPSHAAAGLQFFPPGATLVEISMRLFSRQERIYHVIEQRAMPPRNSIPWFNLNNNPEARLQLLALFAPAP